MGVVGLAYGMLAATSAQAGPRLAQGENGSVHRTAPSLAKFEFTPTPMTRADAFAPWAAFTTQSAADSAALEACIADKATCASPSLLRFRRMLELAAPLSKFEQLNLVQHYFNKVTWTHDARDTWSTLYHTALNSHGDCEDIALAKYQALRRLGWGPEDLRLIVGWDGEEDDWHSWLAVRTEKQIYILDSIEGLKRPSEYRNARAVYSISESGVWDHAPEYVPVTRVAREPTDDRHAAWKRAARHAANPQTEQGVVK
jgi:predicted transglutaminase-like cysteine proteinase